MVETRSQRGGLTEVAPKLYNGDAAINAGNLAKQRKGAVVTAIVDEDKLKCLSGILHNCLQAVIEFGDIVLFVMERNYDRILHSVLDYKCCIHNRCWFPGFRSFLRNYKSVILQVEKE